MSNENVSPPLPELGLIDSNILSPLERDSEKRDSQLQYQLDDFAAVFNEVQTRHQQEEEEEEENRERQQQQFEEITVILEELQQQDEQREEEEEEEEPQQQQQQQQQQQTAAREELLQTPNVAEGGGGQMQKHCASGDYGTSSSSSPVSQWENTSTSYGHNAAPADCSSSMEEKTPAVC